jgi:hypothetical protein
MSATMKVDAKPSSAVTTEANSQADQVVSFGAALLGFMITTTLTTSIMVLLSQG